MNESRIREVLTTLAVPGSHTSYRAGKYLVMACPFAVKKHKGGIDRNPSFGIAIVPDGLSYYNCFTCKQKGTFFNLPDHLARVNDGKMQGNAAGVVYVKSLEDNIAEEYTGFRKILMDAKLNKPEPLNKAIYENMYEEVSDFPEAVHYLSGREITKEAIDIIGIKFDSIEDRIIFPVYGADQELYGFTGRTIIEDWKARHLPPHNIYPRIKDYYGFPKRQFMLGEHRLDPKKPTVVIEGLFGYASLISKGALDIVNVVAILGSVMTPEKARTLINSNTSLYLMLDNDEAGEVGIFGDEKMKGAIHYLKGYCPVYIPQWPDGMVDPDQLSVTDVAKVLEITYPY